MKTLNRLYFTKAIAFLTVVFSIFLLVGCSDAPTVETVRAISISGGSTIEVTGKIISDGGEAVDWAGVCLSRHALPTIHDEFEDGFASKLIFTARFEGLDKNTTYYVRAFAENAIGISYGEVIEVYTLAVQTGVAEVLSNTEATLYATVGDQNSTEVWFEVWRNGEILRRVDIQSTGAQSATEIFATASNLTPGEAYSYAIKAKNATGTVTGETKTFRLYYEQVSDFDGNKYWTVKIGNQIWLESNLKTTRFANGDAIANIQPDNEWVAMTSPAYCYTKNDPELGKVYGALYNNYVGLDPRGLIPGYHAPSIQEYETLVSYLGGGTEAARKLKSNTSDWYNGGKGDNASGFNALPGGWRSDKTDPFTTLYAQANFQTTTPMEGVGAYYGTGIYYNSDYVMTAGAAFKFYGTSIRLIKN